jgi:hypothetical protein
MASARSARRRAGLGVLPEYYPPARRNDSWLDSNRPAMQSAYDRRPSGLRAGSPPFPPPHLIRPIVRLLLRSPRLSGPGPHQQHCPCAARHAARFMPQLFRSQPASGIQSGYRDDVARGNAPPAHCRAICPGSHWSALGRDGRCHTISRRF